MSQPRNSGRQWPCLYRHFDAGGRLLYVGISLSLFHRIQQHTSSAWFDRIATIAIEHHATEAAALAAEAAAIATEKPLFNFNRTGGDVVPKALGLTVPQWTELERDAQSAGISQPEYLRRHLELPEVRAVRAQIARERPWLSLNPKAARRPRLMPA